MHQYRSHPRTYPNMKIIQHDCISRRSIRYQRMKLEKFEISFYSFFGRTRIETLWVLSFFKRSHCQLTNVVTIQGCIPCFFVIEKVSGFSHLPEGTIVVQRTFHAATLAFALKIIKQCSKLTVLICIFSSVNLDEWQCYQLLLDFRYSKLSWLPWLKFLRKLL